MSQSQAASESLVDEYAQKLAEVAVVGRMVRGMVKQADVSEQLQSLLGGIRGGGERLLNWIRENPHLARLLSGAQTAGGRVADWAQANPLAAGTLAGAGIGGGIGGASAIADRRRGDRRSILGGALTGALGGAAVGGGGALAYRSLPDSLKSKLHGFVSGGGASPESGGAGPASGGLRLSPEAQQNAPEVLQRIRELQQRSLPTRALGFVGDAYSNFAKEHPILTGLAGADAAVTTAGTTANILNRARAKPIFSERFDDFFRGLQDVAKGETGTRGVPATDDLLSAAKESVNDRVRLKSLFDKYVQARRADPNAVMRYDYDYRTPGGGTSTTTKQQPDVVVKYPSGKEKITYGGTTTRTKDSPAGRAGFTFDRARMDDITARGAPLVRWMDWPTAKQIGRGLFGWLPSPPPSSRTGRVLKSVGGRVDRVMGGISSRIPTVSGRAALGGRAAVYGGVPLLLEAGRQYAEDADRQAILQKLIQDSVQ